MSVDIVAVHLLNGGLYPDLHHLEPIQTALLDPVLGPQISAGITEEALTAELAPTFADGFDLASVAPTLHRRGRRHFGLEVITPAVPLSVRSTSME